MCCCNCILAACSCLLCLLVNLAKACFVVDSSGAVKHIPAFVAIKPPGTYDLAVLVGNGNQIKQETSNLKHHLNPVFLTLYSNQDQEVLVYNDEDPLTGRVTETGAHAKGVLQLGSTSATWLQHSVPLFPHERAIYPHPQAVFGQHFVCTAMTRTEGEKLFSAIMATDPQIVSNNVTLNRPETLPHHMQRATVSWVDHVCGLLPPLHLSLFTNPNPNQASQCCSNSARECKDAAASAPVVHKMILQTEVGPMFVIAKPPALHEDFWDNLVAPSIGCHAMRVESWIDGRAKNLPSTCLSHFCIGNAEGVSLELHNVSGSYEPDHTERLQRQAWHITSDHSKWAVCCDAVVTCFGDMNRQFAQRHRGGLGLCFGADDRLQKAWSEQLHQYALAWLRPDPRACPSGTCIW